MVVERGDDTEDPLEALLTRLGGVHFVPFDHLVGRVEQLLAAHARAANGTSATAPTLTRAQACAWGSFARQLTAWDGSASGLAALLATPGATEEQQ